MKLGACTSRASPVFEVAATINGKPVRLGLDTLAGLSCVGRVNLTHEELSNVVPTSERLHHAGGEALRSTAEVTPDVEMGSGEIKVTFNVIDTGRHPLGFLLGMDVLEKYAFQLDASARSASFRGEPLPFEVLEELRAFREKRILSAGIKSVVSYKHDEEDEVKEEGRRYWGDGSSIRLSAIRVNSDNNPKALEEESPGEKGEKKEKEKKKENTAAWASRNAKETLVKCKAEWNDFGKKCRDYFDFDGWSLFGEKFQGDSCPPVQVPSDELNLELECNYDLTKDELEVDSEKNTKSDELTALVYDTGGYDFPTKFQLDGQLLEDHEVQDGVKMNMMPNETFAEFRPGLTKDKFKNTEVEELYAEGDRASCGGSVRACERSWTSWFRSAVDDAAGTPPAFVNALATWLPESFDSGQARTLDQLGLFGRALGAVGGLWRAFGPWRAPGAEFGPLAVSSPAVVGAGTEPFVYK